MLIYNDGKEIMHTGFRNVNTKDEIMKLLEDYPCFREQLEQHFDEIFEDDFEDKMKKDITKDWSVINVIRENKNNF